MVTLKDLSERFEAKIKLVENDVEPTYVAEQREMKWMSDYCLDIILRDSLTWTKSGSLRKLNKSHPVFIDTLHSIKEDLKKHRHWSFWHFAGICFVTSIPYAEMLSQGKNKSVDFSKQETWDNANWEFAILLINYISGRRFPNGLVRMFEVVNQPDTDAKTVCRFILKRIEMLR
jgi:hypothetical protein